MLQYCRCGCGEEIPLISKNGSIQRFKYTHNNRGKFNGRWNGGVQKHSSGYILVFKPEHHRANCRGYVYEHILVLEEKLGRELFPGEQVHHINHNKSDNRPENLINLMKNEHGLIHSRERIYNKIDMSNRKCHECGLGVDEVGRNWHHDPNDYNILRCSKCFGRWWWNNNKSDTSNVL